LEGIAMIITGFDSLVDHILSVAHPLGGGYSRVHAERMAEIIEEHATTPEYGEEWPEELLSFKRLTRVYTDHLYTVHLTVYRDGNAPVRFEGEFDLARRIEHLNSIGLTAGDWRGVGLVEPQHYWERPREAFRAELRRDGDLAGALLLSGHDNATLVHLIESAGAETD